MNKNFLLITLLSFSVGSFNNVICSSEIALTTKDKVWLGIGSLLSASFFVYLLNKLSRNSPKKKSTQKTKLEVDEKTQFKSRLKNLKTYVENINFNLEEQIETTTKWKIYNPSLVYDLQDYNNKKENYTADIQKNLEEIDNINADSIKSIRKYTDKTETVLREYDEKLLHAIFTPLYQKTENIFGHPFNIKKTTKYQISIHEMRTKSIRLPLYYVVGVIGYEKFYINGHDIFEAYNNAESATMDIKNIGTYFTDSKGEKIMDGGFYEYDRENTSLKLVLPEEDKK